MPRHTHLEQLRRAPAASFHVLDPIKAKRLNARTLYIPSAADVARVIRAIPRGQTWTTLELRLELAIYGRAETACPAAITKYWKWLAHASSETSDLTTEWRAPWWRVLKDGKPSRHLPGGAEHQLELLEAEGVDTMRMQ
jgi:hypothetical protein